MGSRRSGVSQNSSSPRGGGFLPCPKKGQQARSDYAQGIGDFDFGRDRQALFSARPDNVFVLKVNYWLAL
ncbi:MAG: hypothetical protein MUO50_09285 [Longimicrobiales bacterium]|nr:hypothetical protein [Longimicrobiales bacterium]